MKKLYCKDCNKILSHSPAKRCHSCEMKRRFKKEIMKFTGKNNPNYRDGKCLRQYYCIDCGKLCSLWSAINGNHRCKFCRHKGKLSPNFIHGNGYEPYSSEFNYKLKESIRKRDNYTCQVCHKRQNKRKLDIHHIDYNKNNCNEDNLISLCFSCHMKTNYNRDYWFAYFKYIRDNY